MLPAPNRLPLRTYPNFFTTAQKAHSSSFTAFYTKTNDLVRVAVIVPKKQFSKAVDRNAIKRRVLEAVKKALPSLPRADIALVVRKKAQAKTVTDLSSELITTLKKSHT